MHPKLKLALAAFTASMMVLLFILALIGTAWSIADAIHRVGWIMLLVPVIGTVIVGLFFAAAVWAAQTLEDNGWM